MKKLLYFLFVSMIIGVILSMIFASLPIFPVSTKAFFSAIEKEQEGQAYSMLSPSFQQRMDLEHFKAAMQQSGLDHYKAIILTNQEVDKVNGHAVVKGIVMTKRNSQIPVEIQFTMIQGTSWLDKGWRIDNIVNGKEVPVTGGEINVENNR